MGSAVGANAEVRALSGGRGGGHRNSHVEKNEHILGWQSAAAVIGGKKVHSISRHYLFFSMTCCGFCVYRRICFSYGRL